MKVPLLNSHDVKNPLNSYVIGDPTNRNAVKICMYSTVLHKN